VLLAISPYHRCARVVYMSDDGRDAATTMLDGLRSRRVGNRLGASMYFRHTTIVRDPRQWSVEACVISCASMYDAFSNITGNQIPS